MTTGIYGKLPAHGDFIDRRLSHEFRTSWDCWLRRCIAVSREQLGEHWLPSYLNSPVWRFCLSSGVIDRHVWAGIVIPSVDSIGRYFPFSIVKEFPEATNCFELYYDLQEWYQATENIALQALSQQASADNLIDLIDQLQIDEATQTQVAHYGNLIVTKQEGRSNLASSHCYFTQSLLNDLDVHTAQSLWSTTSFNNTSIICQGLPASEHYHSMLSGHWE
ncbi:type VI secretion system protein ImpM [Sinobacterium caligoides]|uniref:Type VI secretion system protein ImpM n=1 Tax=Sinobacterium caligoides TaxID=933926 RepID=A0A3N2DK30_9GAMM|nr:type VI secretion system-associated protein TagF [Sinobacterium caligoides]ROS00039.1 type VI secretion system protein ImpM [Sinobacterium caligoides]